MGGWEAGGGVISIFGKLSFRQTVRSAKCPFGKMSVRQSVRSAKRPFGKTSVGKMSVRQSVFRQNVRVPYSANLDTVVFRQFVASCFILRENVQECGDVPTQLWNRKKKKQLNVFVLTFIPV
jgi:hypothetical protein